jgi:hypothetical protein
MSEAPRRRATLWTWAHVVLFGRDTESGGAEETADAVTVVGGPRPDTSDTSDGPGPP